MSIYIFIFAVFIEAQIQDRVFLSVPLSSYFWIAYLKHSLKELPAFIRFSISVFAHTSVDALPQLQKLSSFTPSYYFAFFCVRDWNHPLLTLNAMGLSWQPEAVWGNGCGLI